MGTVHEPLDIPDAEKSLLLSLRHGQKAAVLPHCGLVFPKIPPVFGQSPDVERLYGHINGLNNPVPVNQQSQEFSRSPLQPVYSGLKEYIAIG